MPHPPQTEKGVHLLRGCLCLKLKFGQWALKFRKPRREGSKMLSLSYPLFELVPWRAQAKSKA